MAFAAVLIVGGKSPDRDKIPYNAIEGGIVGFLLGSVFARKSSPVSKGLGFGCYFTRLESPISQTSHHCHILNSIPSGSTLAGDLNCLQRNECRN